MEPSADITILAEQIKARSEATPGYQFILFLGKGCGTAAGVPSNAIVARKVLGSLSPGLNIYMPTPDETNDVAWEQAFYKYLSGLSSMQRNRVLQLFYRSIPVPAFYQDLAGLIKSGFFPHILTTNIDTLLEQALNGVGLWPDKDYLVVSLGYGSDQSSWGSITERESSNISWREPITIIKLHGDLEQSDPAMGVDEIRRALQVHRRQVKEELSGDLMMVGYEFESPPVSQWLGYTPGEIWWVNRDPPDESLLRPIAEKREVKLILNQTAQPEIFFGQLVYLLLKQSSPKKAEVDELEISVTDNVQEMENVQIMGSGVSSTSAYSDAEYIRGQIRRNQQALANLLQNAIPGEINLQLKQQIDYQQRTITKMEDQLRDLTSSRERVRSLMQEIADAIENSNSDSELRSFVQAQSSSIAQAYQRDNPNQDIISAAIGATVLLAERLDPQIVKPEVIRELASYASSGSIKGVG